MPGFAKRRVGAPLPILAAAVLLAAAIPSLAQPADDVLYAWSPKPDSLTPYGQNRPVTRLPAVLAKHKGQSRWSQQVLLTKRFDAKWIQAAPGDQTPTQYYGDDRVVWVVWSGQIRFTIQGQQPFVAGKGFLVQVPQRVRYSLETIGSEPSLRFEVTRTGIKPSYPADEGQPKPPEAGDDYIKISTPTQPDKYDDINRPFVDFFKDGTGHGEATQTTRVVSDEAQSVTMVRGPGVETPPARDKGQFHIGKDEFWFVLEGESDYRLEGVKPFTADAGDIVFVPSGHFHRVNGAKGQMDTRLAFTASPMLFQNFAADAGGK